MPSTAARWTSSIRASIDFFQSVVLRAGQIDQVRIVGQRAGDAGVGRGRAELVGLLAVIGLPRHWLVFLVKNCPNRNSTGNAGNERGFAVKICKQSQPTAAARSTALWWPPAIDM